MPRDDSGAAGALVAGRRWRTPDYARAAGYAACLIAPLPFFWAPPLWGLA